jgi:hypothetical protein
MQLAFTLKLQQAAELIVPGKYPLNRIESLFEYGAVASEVRKRFLWLKPSIHV